MMNAPAFMVYVQFQQRASDYRAGMRDADRLAGQLYAYPDEVEEAQNKITLRQLDPLIRATDRLYAELQQAQRHVVSVAGRTVRP